MVEVLFRLGHHIRAAELRRTIDDVHINAVGISWDGEYPCGAAGILPLEVYGQEQPLDAFGVVYHRVLRILSQVEHGVLLADHASIGRRSAHERQKHEREYNVKG